MKEEKMKIVLSFVTVLILAGVAMAADQVQPKLSVDNCLPHLGDTLTLSAVYPNALQKQVDPSTLAASQYAGYPLNPILTVLCWDTNNFVAMELRVTFRDTQRKIAGGFKSSEDVVPSNANASGPMHCECYLTHLTVTVDGVEQFTDATIPGGIGASP